MLDRNGFDLWADGYDTAVEHSDEERCYPFAGYRDVLARIYRAVSEKPHAEVLDIGFGTGTLTAALYRNGCRIYGQDFSGRMIAAAAEKMPDAQLYQWDFSQGLAEPLRQRRYDYIISTYALHHLTDAQKAAFIAQLLERLKPGGKLFIGDVAFQDRSELAQCRQAAGDEWDDEEYYFVADELSELFPELRFEKASFCAGVLTLCR